MLDEAEYLDFKEFVILGHVPLMESVHLATIIKRLTDFTKEMEEEGETGIIPKMVKGIEQQKIGQILKYVTVYDLLHPFRKNDKETRLTNAIKTLQKNVSSDIQGSSLDEDVREIMFEERKKEMWIANKDLYIEEYKKRIKVIEELDTSDPDFGKNLTKVSINIS